MQTRTWIRALAHWGSLCVAWSSAHQDHPFAVWSCTDDAELKELLDVVRKEREQAGVFGWDDAEDFSVKYVRVAWAT